MVRDIDISGATDAAIVVGDGARAAVATAAIHDNPGVGILARRGSHLALRHSSVAAQRHRHGTPARPGVHLEDGASASFAGNAIGDNGAGAVTGLPADALAALARDNVVRPLPRARPRPRVAPATSAPSPPRP